MNELKNKLDRRFKITERGSKISTEILAGCVTFLTMAYILAVNPATMLGGVAPAGSALYTSVFLATALAAAVGCILTALLSNLPFAQAPGMGLNALFNGVLLGWAAVAGYTFDGVMTIVFISGVIFILITSLGLRKHIFEGVPEAIRNAIPVGIGLFIAFIGLKGAGVITYISTGTGASDFLPQLVTFSNIFKGGFDGVAPALVALIGFLTIAILAKNNVRGAVLIGIAVSTIIGIPMGVTPIKNITSGWNIVENFGKFFSFNSSEGGTFGAFAQGFSNAFRSDAVITTIILIITFCMIDMFDTIGTLVGCATKANLMEEKNGTMVVKNGEGAMVADATATVVGAVLGTSTVTTYVESGAGVAEGGKTGFTAIVVGILFLLSIFISPIFAIIPAAATAPALIYVGVLMMSTVTKIDFNDIKVAVPAFLTIFLMPLTYSITNGIGIGILSYVIISLACYIVDIIKYNIKKTPDAVKPKFPISIVTGIIAVLFIVLYFVPVSF